MYTISHKSFVIIMFLCSVVLTLCVMRFANAQGGYDNPCAPTYSLPPQGLLNPIQPNIYGPGVHSDATGKPYIWKPW